mmetsp:Transcript_114945/g.297916  ORF Transcript_114945/g.297916 Transcript_114945/m.297916 type:complete len:143 (+) Transcript_114945:125-553(+)|eukprot:CAMPEP_0115208046 /NCGR_PEP_ID=MMETSP0270-20121206/21027_1 /TAXON_ID=71861 /ORGANISM="Scrippsiella trochoidea, Strain CCMP3099" /LENGTH=142 /DNA_ID=CAMNT_0002621653 /DNA_START=81 /DNA_END=509 /DNA_ORIENTATION=-
MGNKCCAAEEVAGGQKDITEAQSAVAAKTPDAEEPIKKNSPEPAAPAAAEGSKKSTTREWKVTLKKTGGARLGVDVDLSDGVSLLVDSVNDGLMGDWNKANPDKAVKKDDRIISVNGQRGNATNLTEVCKNDDVLEMLVQRD